MNLRVRLLSLSVLLLFAGAAMVPFGAADHSAEHCEEEYRDDLDDGRDDANARYEDCMHDLSEREEASRDDHDDETDDHEDDEHDEDEEHEEEDDHDEYERDLPLTDHYDGEHVSFDITDVGVGNYTVDGEVIFRSVSGERIAEWDEFKLEGATLNLEADDTEVRANDVPTGVFRFEADDDQQVTVVLADGMVAELARDAHDDDEDDDSSSDHDDDDRDDETDDHEDDDHDADSSGHGKYHYVLTRGDLTAHLFVDEGHSYDNATGIITAPEEVRMVVTGSHNLEAKSESSKEGIADGRIAVEIEVPRNGRALGAEYGDVNVTVTSTATGLRADIDSEGEGKTILFTLEEGALGDLRDIEVLFDGQPIGLADDAEDVLDTSDGVAEYLILVGADGAEILVQVPHFSPHTIELNAGASSANIPGPSMVFVASGVLGLAAAAHAARRQ